MIQNLLDLIFPKRCLHCKNIIQNCDYLCVKCSNSILFTNWNCDLNNDLAKSIIKYVPIKAAYSLFLFEKGTVNQSLIHNLKYKNLPELGTTFANLIFDKIFDFKLLNNIDGIIYVPIHKKKLEKRGYNQIENLANQLAKKLCINIFKDALKVSEYQESITTKNKENRYLKRKNIIKKDKDLKKGTYILLDDVSTSGATLINCIKELYKNKSIEIVVITIAFTY